MSTTLATGHAPALATAFWPNRLTDEAATPWVPLSPGRAFKPLRFLAGDRGYVALMRVEAGVAIPPHRHTEETHAFTLEGARVLADGTRVGPGDYVYEPAGNTDTWRATDDGDCIVLIVVYGAVEYLDGEGRVAQRFSAEPMLARYRAYCAEQGLTPADLVD